MGKHSKNDRRWKGGRIAAAAALILVVATAIALGSFGQKPTDKLAGGGGGNTGNSVTVDPTQ